MNAEMTILRQSTDLHCTFKHCISAGIASKVAANTDIFTGRSIHQFIAAIIQNYILSGNGNFIALGSKEQPARHACLLRISFTNGQMDWLGSLENRRMLIVRLTFVSVNSNLILAINGNIVVTKEKIAIDSSTAGPLMANGKLRILCINSPGVFVVPPTF